MKPLEQHEIFAHLSQYLKAKGIELKDGTYTQRVQKGCALLTETINLSQRGYEKAKVTLDRKLDQVRQVIHEKTAPKSAPKPAASASTSQPKAASPKAKKKAPARKKSPSAKKS